MMESSWSDLASGVHERIVNALAALSRHAPRDITLGQARSLVTALSAANTRAERAATWPKLLSLLNSWAKSLDSSRSSTGSQSKRPLRPWERQQQQHTPSYVAQQQQSPITSQQPAQQQIQARLDVLQHAASVVTATLQDASADAENITTAGPCTDVLAILGPCITFLSAAVTAVAATTGAAQLHLQLQESSVAAACSTLAAAAPHLLAPGVDKSRFNLLLSGVQQLLLACKDNDQCMLWLLSCLLAAVQESMACGLPQCIAAATSSSSSSSNPANATTALQQDGSWKAQQAEALAVLQISGWPKALYSVGHGVGSAFAKAIAAAASPTQQQQQQWSVSSTAKDDNQHLQQETLPEFTVLRQLKGVVGLLCTACSEGELAVAAVTAAAAAGVVAGSLEELPSTSVAAAAAAGSLGDVWATTVAAGNATRQQQQQQLIPAMQTAAVLDPQWLQQLKGQLSSLLVAVDSAARQCIDQAAAAAGGALPHACALLLGYVYSNLMATHSEALGLLQQQQSISSVHCGLIYIMHQCCGLSGVMHHAGCCSDAAAANAWLAAQQQQHPPHEVALLARWLANAIANSPTDQQPLLLQAVKQESEQVADCYDCYICVTKTDVLQQVNAGAVRQQLDRMFATVVAVLSYTWQQQQQQVEADSSSSSSGALEAAAVVGQGLAALTALQFCRVDLPAYADLLRGLVTTLASSNAAADAFLAAAVPCYEKLVQPVAAINSSSSSSDSCNACCRAQGPSIVCECSQNSSSCCCSSSSTTNSGTHAWLNSPVLIAKLSFLLPLLPVACNAASDAAAAASRVLPLVLLLLPHPVQQLSQGAHAAFAGLLTAAANFAPRQSTAAHEVQQQRQQQQQSVREAIEQAIPFYLQRSVEGLPQFGSLEGLAVGFTCILKHLSAGSVMSLLAINRITQCAMQLAVEASAASTHTDTVPPGTQQQQQTAAAHGISTNSSTDSPPRTAATAAARLFELVQLSLQLVDFRLLPNVLQHISSAVLAAPSAVQNSWIMGLYSSCRATEDYVRKPALIAWVDGLNKEVVQVQRGRQKAAASVVEQGNHPASRVDGTFKPAQPPFLVV